ncbi:MAG: hypothetical protein ACREFP_11720 [Acetobacteraceae bacterium]
MADPSDTTGKRRSPKAGITRTARQIAESILADLKRTSEEAQTERLAEILWLLADTAPAE